MNKYITGISRRAFAVNIRPSARSTTTLRAATCFQACNLGKIIIGVALATSIEEMFAIVCRCIVVVAGKLCSAWTAVLAFVALSCICTTRRWLRTQGLQVFVAFHACYCVCADALLLRDQYVIHIVWLVVFSCKYNVDVL